MIKPTASSKSSLLLPSTKAAWARKNSSVTKPTRRDVSELWPTACYTADGHSFKATVLHPFHGQPFKPELTAVLDVYTGYLSGWHAGLSENALDVMYALSDAMLEREDGRHRGIGSLFYTDNGPGFKNKLMNAPSTGFCERWGMMSVNSLPYNSQARGMIEVLNKNLWIRAAKKLDSYCGKDADKEARRTLKKKTNKELRAYRTPSLHMAWKDFLGFIQEEVDAYNNRPHRRMPKTRDHQTLKMRHMTPKEMWTQSLEEGLIEPYIIPVEHAAELHRPYEERKVSRCEVKLPMGRYFSRDLEAFHGKRVMVGYDIHDNSKVWVRDFDMRLLAVADLDGNAVPYFPIQTVTDVAASQRELLERNEFSMTAAQLKQRKRTKNRLKTVQTRTHEIMEEYMGPPIEIEHPQDEPFTLEQDARADAFLERMEQRSVPPESPRVIIANGRPVFRDDFEWVQWLIDHPDQVTSYDLSQVKEKTGHKFFMERLLDEGIDVGPLLEMAA